MLKKVIIKKKTRSLTYVSNKVYDTEPRTNLSHVTYSRAGAEYVRYYTNPYNYKI